jgi:hypothetical protein
VLANESGIVNGIFLQDEMMRKMFEKFPEVLLIDATLRLSGLGNNNEKLGLPERLSAGILFRFRNLFHGKISGNRNFVCLYVARSKGYIK